MTPPDRPGSIFSQRQNITNTQSTCSKSRSKSLFLSAGICLYHLAMVISYLVNIFSSLIKHLIISRNFMGHFHIMPGQFEMQVWNSPMGQIVFQSISVG